MSDWRVISRWPAIMLWPVAALTVGAFMAIWTVAYPFLRLMDWCEARHG